MRGINNEALQPISLPLTPRYVCSPAPECVLIVWPTDREGRGRHLLWWSRTVLRGQAGPASTDQLQIKIVISVHWFIQSRADVKLCMPGESRLAESWWFEGILSYSGYFGKRLELTFLIKLQMARGIWNVITSISSSSPGIVLLVDLDMHIHCYELVFKI